MNTSLGGGPKILGYRRRLQFNRAMFISYTLPTRDGLPELNFYLGSRCAKRNQASA
ncbi:MAG: hypothetical protein HOJ91_00395 [Rhodospirillaceae bacterium]|nr:hypothetical protein [Rhodospirillaceae bacterium]